MIINGNDKWIGPSIEQFGAWAADDIELIARVLDILLADRDHVTFYDVGANIGTHTVALARHFDTRISIRAFEAQRQMFYILCGNVAINGLDNVFCHHCAVSDGTVEAIDILLPDYHKINNFGGLELMDAVNSDNSLMSKCLVETVSCVTVDSYRESVDFVKLDIEGMELRALQGARHIIQASRPICFVEVLKSDVEAIRDFFRQYSYILYQYKSDDWIFVPEESNVELDLPKILL
jgi:FkbM family methyltransferase